MQNFVHFTPSIADDDILSNLLFADGAAAVLVVGNDHEKSVDKTVLEISAISSATIPHTLDLMTWNISSSAFRMHLSKYIVDAIRENVSDAINEFIHEASSTSDYWAIHPGGVRIVDAVKESLALTENDVQDSLAILENYGNMSSPTILFVLQRIFDKIKKDHHNENKNIITCAFGPGLTIEMMNLSVVNTTVKSIATKTLSDYEIQK